MEDRRKPPAGGMTYRGAGVDVDAGNALVEAIRPAVRTTERTGLLSQIGGFGGLFDPRAAGYADPVLVAANDGVGTKLKIAFETGRHDTVGIDLVAMCVNDLVVQGAEPLFFLDYFSTGKLDISTARTVIEGIAAGCRQAGCALIGGETAEMPDMYAVGEYDLAGFAVGAVERQNVLPRGDLAPGDVLVGLASSGLHSNGFSLVRRIVERSGARLDTAAPFSSGIMLGEALLEPTRIYVRPVLQAIAETGAIKALAHVTGGGFVENIPRVLPNELAARVDLGAFAVPSVFGWLRRVGEMEEGEMLRTFNCGIGMIAIAAEREADAVMAAFADAGETAYAIGRLEARTGAAVAFDGKMQK